MLRTLEEAAMIETALLIFIFLFFLLVPILLGVPVAYSIGITSIILLLLPIGPTLGTVTSIEMMSIRMYRGSTSFILLAIPFYLFAGRLLIASGSTDVIFEFAERLMGPIKGGIGHVNVVASILFSGMSGSAIADAAGLGTVEFDMMKRGGYDDGFAVGITGSSAIIGPIIPPSIPLILYGVLAETSIGDLFIGGVIPGLLMGLSLMAYIYYVSARRGYESGNTWELQKLARATIRALPALTTIILIIGGILSGWFTATEAGAVAVLWVTLIGVFWYGEMNLSNFYEAAYDTMIDTSALLLILASAMAYAFVVVAAGIPQQLASLLVALDLGPTGVLFVLVFVLLLLGMVLGPITNIILVLPIIAPEFATLGIDPLHFGIVMVLALMIGLLTPPVGAVLFVLEQVTDVPVERISVAMLPFYVPLFMVLLVVILVPETVTYLPGIR